jgi:AbiU2
MTTGKRLHLSKEKIKAIASLLIDESIACNRQSAIFKRLLQSNEVVGAFNRRQAGQTLELIRMVFYRDLALRCINALADNDSRTISFFQVGALLRDCDLIVDLRQDFIAWRKTPFEGETPGNSSEYEGVHQVLTDDEVQKFDQQISELKKYADHFAKNTSPEYIRIRHLRDQMLAHNQLNDPLNSSVARTQPEANLNYGELWELVRDLQKAAELLQSVCNSESFDFANSDTINTREADRFVAVFER